MSSDSERIPGISSGKVEFFARKVFACLPDPAEGARPLLAELLAWAPPGRARLDIERRLGLHELTALHALSLVPSCSSWRQRLVLLDTVESVFPELAPTCAAQRLLILASVAHGWPVADDRFPAVAVQRALFESGEVDTACALLLAFDNVAEFVEASVPSLKFVEAFQKTPVFRDILYWSMVHCEAPAVAMRIARLAPDAPWRARLLLQLGALGDAMSVVESEEVAVLWDLLGKVALAGGEAKLAEKCRRALETRDRRARAWKKTAPA